MREVKTTKNISFRSYTLSHAKAVETAKALNLPPIWKLREKFNAVPEKKLDELVSIG